jgi:hypothetical protein
MEGFPASFIQILGFSRLSDMSFSKDDAYQLVAEHLHRADYLLLACGAGISVESGLAAVQYALLLCTLLN